MTRPLSTLAAMKRPEIERMSGYVNDDGAIAAYFRIDRGDVAIIRANIKHPKHVRFKAERTEGGDHAGSGRDSYLAARTDGERGSEALRIAVITSIARHAKQHRIDIDTAAGRLLSGRVG